MEQTPKKYTPQEALPKIRKYCAYQERSHKEVKTKLATWGVYGLDAGNIITRMMEENFINEERFAQAIAEGRFRQKGWGRKKIEAFLKAKGVEDYLLQHCLDGIEEKDYAKKCKLILEKKLKTVKAKNEFELKRKLAAYAMGKGFEGNLVWETIERLSI